jgi:hypothetical protein
MRHYYPLIAAALGAAAPSPALAQAQTLVIGEAAETKNVLKRGTEIRMETLRELNSNEAKVGDRFDLEVTEDVKLNGRTIIRAGTRGVGEVTLAKKKGMWGKSGKLETRLLYLEVGEQRIRINGAAGDKGRAGTAGVVGALAVVPIAGFFVTGTSAVLPPRTATIASLDEDIPVRFAGK